MTKVAVFGAGVAGLTAAHELRCRGYEVHVYERRAQRQVGGKARTQYWDSDAGGGELRGEHGFRFFPAFYALLDDTMKRIPLDPASEDLGDAKSWLAPTKGKNVYGNLIEPKYQAFGRDGQPITRFPRRPGNPLADLTEAIRFYYDGLQIPPVDMVRIWWRCLVFLFSCDERRREVYEYQTYFKFMQANLLKTETQYTLRRVPRALVAMDADSGNARTLSNVAFLLMADALKLSMRGDRILNGPTSEKWLIPWRDWLGAIDVKFHWEKSVTGFELAGTKIARAVLDDGTKVEADYFVSAVPLEVMKPLVSSAMASQSSELDALSKIDLGTALSWMVGAQFYLKNDVPVVNGHVAYLDSPWSLTSISQAQFWSNDFKNDYGNGIVDGVLSVDVSEWFREKGKIVNKKPRWCTRNQLYQELVGEIGAVLTDAGDPILADSNVVTWHLDDDIVYWLCCLPRNESRLLVHPPGLLDQRPSAKPGLDNLYLASDYVANDTDLATMEGANQAARDAVNALLDDDGSIEKRADSIDHLDAAEPAWLKAVKAIDCVLYKLGKPVLVETIDIDALVAIVATLPEDDFWDFLQQTEQALKLLTEALDSP